MKGFLQNIQGKFTKYQSLSVCFKNNDRKIGLNNKDNFYFNSRKVLIKTINYPDPEERLKSQHPTSRTENSQPSNETEIYEVSQRLKNKGTSDNLIVGEL